MAAPAVVSEVAVVDVVGPMTIAAALAELGLPGERPPVAALAGHAGVRACERKAGLGVVLELPAQPVDGIVAARAIAGEPAFMLIVVCMAVDTVSRRSLKYPGLVAVVALGLGVPAEQRETRQVVIEKDVLDP